MSIKHYRYMMLILGGLFLISILSGCITQKSVTVSQVVLLPEDRIFTVPAGQKIDVLLDGKSLPAMIFPGDMKLVSPTILVRQEEQLNNAILDKAKADKNRNKWVAILTSVFGSIAAIFGVWQKAKKKTETK